MNKQVQAVYEHFAATYDNNRGLFNMDAVFESVYLKEQLTARK